MGATIEQIDGRWHAVLRIDLELTDEHEHLLSMLASITGK